MSSLIIISWRDIPAQVIVKKARETGLVHSFLQPMDNAAKPGNTAAVKYTTGTCANAGARCKARMVAGRITATPLSSSCPSDRPLRQTAPSTM